ncbi:hypothetical protein GCM10008959_09200 [Deinococcus seoulensis]|uniref:Uncharacterized protein n=1 Tax=Deinococcus seoulensis TaxID=1837379 RepID=A0ABQ2RR88_9DEIO|nr:hypothetical protein [Deinococcus seoulensis]GGR50228.1 hypothetical protein GCM10008959_09200 [Deinococcus seoulensis]
MGLLDVGAGLSPLLAAALALLGGYWMLRMGRAARLGLTPRGAWWAVPGLLLMLLAPVLDVPALFGVGAALLLLAEFLPAAFVPAAPGPAGLRWDRLGWPLVGVTLGVGLLLALRDPANLNPLTLCVAVAALLFSGAGLVSALVPARRRAAPFDSHARWQTRWNHVVTPDWPDLSVTLSEQGAHLKNVSGRPLRLAGWSPAGMNAWLSVRGASGEPLLELRAGQEALLPVTAQDSGVRVWYAPARVEDAHLYRADWTPTAYSDSRVLN